ncbi:anti-sigma factor C-terminal domain-containing protein [Peribacillus butanolivorans]|uniref:anti sigma factor C-terminal domain-containing protein n=1 Tax=Peribacillus butanolivorans TaxID=421767 RepID=UPI00207C95A3|nr:anti sigma factor C-terminal domain-containing protein [Peribacillus butanolivorans]MCO0597049.1 anti-sigma factor C-terminal domain-containing protein [Peribacillus butanolivorans]
MSDKNESNKVEEIDFTSGPSMQKVIKKSKRKQTIKYVIITVLTTIILLTLLFLGSNYILNKRVDTQDSSYDMVHGANISSGGTTYTYNLFSITTETTYKKTIGDRSIVWDKEVKKVPLFGRIKTIEKGSGMMEVNYMNEDAKRYVRYNDFNNERKIDFYYPNLPYDYLPHELDIAAGLDENKLIEVALSFKEPMTMAETAKNLGQDNVNWLWVDTTTPAQMDRMKDELDHDSLKTKGGGGAFGFDVSPGSPYSEESGQGFIVTLEQLSKTDSHKSSIKEALKDIKENTQSTKGEIRLNGAVVTGTPKELKRFQNLDFIRASILGATTDKY